MAFKKFSILSALAFAVILPVLVAPVFAGAKKAGNPVAQDHPPSLHVIEDQYKTIQEVQEALIAKGLESSDLIIGIDFTKSNYASGRKTTALDLGPEYANLHHLDPARAKLNPYQEAMAVIAQSLARFDKDQWIPAYGFGDLRTTNEKLFSLNSSHVTFPFEPIGPDNNAYVHTLDGVLAAYEQTASHLARLKVDGTYFPNRDPLEIKPDGPTSFEPLVQRAIQHVRQSGFTYHVLLILTDGIISDKKANAKIFLEAAKYPLSIIIVGLGDGPFTQMQELDDNQVHEDGEKRKTIDNVQFVNFHQIASQHRDNLEKRRQAFAVAALQELPSQYELFTDGDLLGRKNPLYKTEYEEIYQQRPWHPGQKILDEPQENPPAYYVPAGAGPSAPSLE